jgi:hypothetical protein
MRRPTKAPDLRKNRGYRGGFFMPPAKKVSRDTPKPGKGLERPYRGPSGAPGGGTVKQELDFKERPRIANRSDALELLERIIEAEYVRGLDKALSALRDALEREII